MKVNLRSGYDIWPHEGSNDIFAASMWWKYFSFLAHLLSFNDKTTQLERWNFDRLASNRDIFEEINKQNASMRYLSPFLSVDETLYPYRGHTYVIKRYNRSKSNNYALLYYSLCDAVVQHCVKIVCIRCNSALYFPAFRLTMERYGVHLSAFSPNVEKYGSECLHKHFSHFVLYLLYSPLHWETISDK